MDSIKTKLQEDVKTAMKARDQEKVTSLRQLVSEIKRIEIDTRKELSDEEIISILQKEIKKRRDALEFAKEAKREDIISQNEKEIATIQSYLGEQYSREKLKELISAIIAGGNDNIGKIMGALNKDHKGKFEGKVASEVVKELLG